jgi:hypothetical protein
MNLLFNALFLTVFMLHSDARAAKTDVMVYRSADEADVPAELRPRDIGAANALLWREILRACDGQPAHLAWKSAPISKRATGGSGTECGGSTAARTSSAGGSERPTPFAVATTEGRAGSIERDVMLRSASTNNCMTYLPTAYKKLSFLDQHRRGVAQW